MAVTSVREEWSGSTAGASGEQRTARRTFTVQCSSPQDGPLVAQTATGIPRKGEAHPKDTWLRAELPSVRPLSPTLFRVEVDYLVPSSGGAAGENPLQQPAQRRWTHVTSQEPVDLDARGRVMTNTAGQTFDPPIVADRNDPVLAITRNEATYDEARTLRYQEGGGAVNKDTFYGAGPGCARMISIDADEIHEGRLHYWRVAYVIQFRRDGWKRRRVNTGLMQKKNGELLPIFDPKTGQPVTEPVPLDRSGLVLGAGQQPIVLEFDLYPALPFSALRL